MRSENNVLGIELANNIRVLAHSINLEREHSIGIIGGKMEVIKLISIY